MTAEVHIGWTEQNPAYRGAADLFPLPKYLQFRLGRPIDSETTPNGDAKD